MRCARSAIAHQAGVAAADGSRECPTYDRATTSQSLVTHRPTTTVAARCQDRVPGGSGRARRHQPQGRCGAQPDRLRIRQDQGGASAACR